MYRLAEGGCILLSFTHMHTLAAVSKHILSTYHEPASGVGVRGQITVTLTLDFTVTFSEKRHV